MTSTAPGKRLQQTYVAARHDGAWHVVDARDGRLVESFPPGAAGAEAARSAASTLNASKPKAEPTLDLRAWRRGQKLTLKRLAAALGVSWETVQRWETGVQSMPPYLHLALEALEHKERHLMCSSPDCGYA